MLKSHTEIIDLWPSQEALAADIGLSASAVRKWRQRRRIPSEAWPAIVDASNRRVDSGEPGSEVFAEVTADLLMRLQSAPARDTSEERASA